MCWCLRVYWTVLNNLFARFFNNLANTFQNNQNTNCFGYCCCCSCCCCCYDCMKCRQVQNRGSKPLNEFDVVETLDTFECASSTSLQHDYVIVDDIDANYVEIERRKIETEAYYRTVDRKVAETILADREDGACIVRPFKKADISIKYITSVYANQQYFHLFIRQINGKELYGIGQAKPNERLFTTPNEIIDFYSVNPLLCTNKSFSISLTLKPIID